MMKNTRKTSLALAAGLALALGAGTALAESQYGFQTTGAATAQARVNLSVTVPKLILLRVGSANTTIDTVSWTASPNIPAVPTTPVIGNNTNVNWDGSAPTSVTATPTGNVLDVAAWTNAGTGSLNGAISAWAPATGGPASADITVGFTGSLEHPGTNLGTFTAWNGLTSNTLFSGQWTYTLGGNPSTWAAGTYTSQITYTATSI